MQSVSLKNIILYNSITIYSFSSPSNAFWCSVVPAATVSQTKYYKLDRCFSLNFDYGWCPYAAWNGPSCCNAGQTICHTRDICDSFRRCELACADSAGTLSWSSADTIGIVSCALRCGWFEGASAVRTCARTLCHICRIGRTFRRSGIYDGGFVFY